MSELDNVVNFADALSENENIKPLTDLMETIMSLPDDKLTDNAVEMMCGAIQGMVTPNMKRESAQSIIDSFDEQNLTRAQAISSVNGMKEEITSLVANLAPSAAKKALLDKVFNSLYEIFDEAIERYHNYSIELPIQLEEGARVPTYAHETGDVAADLYAADTIVVPAHSISNMIRTGVHIALPEGWAAYIVPRSSIGAKTPLRLSNSVGVIDSSYRGPLGILYDNISDSDYIINAGDRIAQLIVMPSYRFKPRVVDGALDETERGAGGFGSTGK